MLHTTCLLGTYKSKFISPEEMKRLFWGGGKTLFLFLFRATNSFALLLKLLFYYFHMICSDTLPKNNKPSIYIHVHVINMKFMFSLFLCETEEKKYFFALLTWKCNFSSTAKNSSSLNFVLFYYTIFTYQLF